MDTLVTTTDAAGLRELFERDPKLGYRMMSGVAEALSNRLAGARVQLANA